MNEVGSKVPVINQELEENYAHLDRQHAQVKWFVQLYTFALIGLFSLAGYLASHPNPPLTHLIGLSAGFVLFCLGWLLLSTLANKMGMIVLTHKQIALLRGYRLDLLKSDLEDKYVFPTKPKDVRFPKLVEYTPYLFFIVNYIILCGGAAFFISDFTNISVGLTSSFAIGVIAGLFYPNSCVEFNKHIKTAGKATSLENMRNLEKAFTDFRKQSRKKHIVRYLVLLVILFLLVIIAVGLLLLSILLEPYSSVHKTLIMLSVLNAVIFAVIRFGMEKIKGSKI
jgi:hypothetical protein